MADSGLGLSVYRSSIYIHFPLHADAYSNSIATILVTLIHLSTVAL